MPASPATVLRIPRRRPPAAPSVMPVVERGIPAPPSRLKYPFGDMEVGDSFFLATRSKVVRASLYSCAGYKNVRITVGSVVENGVVGFRVWRIAEGV